MNTSTASVLPLTAIALCLTPARIYELLGLEWSIACLEAARQARSRREVLLLKDELEPVGYDGFGAPLLAHQLPPAL